MRAAITLALVLVCTSIHGKQLLDAQDGLSSRQDDTAWWKNTIVYQIYPRSFQDSDDDGTGDLNGITSRLDYLDNLNIETFWLSPIFKSPMADFGYDISDFQDIDPIFGTMADFDAMVAQTKSLDMKVVLDFIPNHSSDQHEWFQMSKQSIDPFTDYYVWRDPAGFDTDGTPIPPNNWLSVFRYSAWEWVEERQQFYYHAFLKEQPDLNYRNPFVVEEMKDNLRFWLDKGVDGFRMDAVPFLYEDQQFLDEPESGNQVIDENDYYYLDHIYTYNLPEVYNMLAEFNSVLDEYEAVDGFDRVMMVEATYHDVTFAEIMQYYDCTDFPFNFNFIEHLSSPLTATALKTEVDLWLDNMPDGKTANWVLGNHDNWRVGSRFVPELADGLNFVSMLLPGVAVTYYGEELGMLNTDISFEETVDPSGCNCGPDHFADQGCSRDPERTPMQWSDDNENAGFTGAGVTPWLPVNPNYATVNVEAQKDTVALDGSSLAVYEGLTFLRMRPEVMDGDSIRMVDGTVFAFSRRLNGVARLVVALNTDPNPAVVDISSLDPTESLARVTLRSSNSNNANTVVGNTVNMTHLEMDPYEALAITFYC